MRHNTADFLDETGSISMLDAPFGAYEKAILRSMVLSLLAARIKQWPRAAERGVPCVVCAVRDGDRPKLSCR